MTRAKLTERQTLHCSIICGYFRAIESPKSVVISSAPIGPSGYVSNLVAIGRGHSHPAEQSVDIELDPFDKEAFDIVDTVRREIQPDELAGTMLRIARYYQRNHTLEGFSLGNVRANQRKNFSSLVGLRRDQVALMAMVEVQFKTFCRMLDNEIASRPSCQLGRYLLTA